MKIVVFIFAMAVVVLGMDPTELYRDSYKEPSHIFASCFTWKHVDEFICGAGGKIDRPSLSFSFSSSYHQMDSLYVQSYSEMNFVYKRNYLLWNVGYGLSMEWIPGESLWNRHRYKLGGMWLAESFYLSALTEGWLSASEKTFQWELMGGLRSNRFGEVFALWNGQSIKVGNEVFWKYFSIGTSYIFPDFEISVQVSIYLGRWVSRSRYGFLSDKREWFGQVFEKKF